MAGAYRINPRIRAYGKARIDVTLRANNEQEWQSMWKAPAHAYPFTAGEGWKFCIEYRVNDFAAEIGFFIDVLGFSVYSFSPSFAQFTSPSQSFLFGVSATPEGEQSTSPDTLRLQFKVSDLIASVQELEQRGISFEQSPMPVQEGTSMHIAIFRTPHGIPVDLWGEVESLPNSQAAESVAVEPETEQLQPQEEVEEAPVQHEAPVTAQESPEADRDESGDEELEDAPKSNDEQAGFWTQLSRSVGGIKDKSLRTTIGGKERGAKRTPGNGEITYAPIEDENGENEDSGNEEYP